VRYKSISRSEVIPMVCKALVAEAMGRMHDEYTVHYHAITVFTLFMVQVHIKIIAMELKYKY